MWYPQVSFRNGEVSPRLDGLSNPEVYDASCRKVEGAIVSSSGTVEKRSGTRFVDDTAFSTSVNSAIYTSDACKLIPMVHGSDIYVLVFEVMSDSTGDEDSWGVIRAVVNDTFITSVNEASPSSVGWTTGYNLPFRSITAGTDEWNYWPPGTVTTSAGSTNGYTGLFGQHNFTATQLPDLQYFQHEEVLVVLHPDAAPIQVYITTDSAGVVKLSTRPYLCKGRSPGVKRSGERFSMVVTGQTDSAGTWFGDEVAWDVETTRDWFDESDMFAIYRVGHARMKNPAPHPPTGAGDTKPPNIDYNDWGEDLRGLYAMVTRIHSSKKVEMKTVTTLPWYADALWDFEGLTDDPLDWDGPWVAEPTADGSIFYQHTDQPEPGDMAAPGGAGYAPVATSMLNSASYKQNPTQVLLRSVALSGTAADRVTNLNQLVGCVVTKRVIDNGTATKTAALAMVAMTGTETGANPQGTVSTSGDGDPIAIAYIMAGTTAHPGTVDYATWQTDTPAQDIDGQVIYRLRDKRTKALLPTITMAAKWNTWSDTTTVGATPIEPGLYKKIQAGDEVFLYVGNVPDTDIFKHIPENHDAAFDTTTHGDVADPTVAGTVVDIGGVVHINGGSFALKEKKLNCYVAHCIVAPIHQSITSKFELGWSTAVGFPSCGVSHQGRVLLSGFTKEKRVIVGSVADDPTNFVLGGDASDGMHFIVNDLRGSQVQWLASGKDLIIGTDSAEFSITGSPLSPLSIGVDRQSAYGSAGVRPVIVGNLLLYTQKDRKTIRAMQFNFANQRYVSKNITLGHEHLFNAGTITDMIVWEGEEDPVIMVRLSDGEVLACRVNETAGFFGWSRMKLPPCSAICPSRTQAKLKDDFYVSLEDTGKYRLARYEDSLFMDEVLTPNTTTYADPNLTITLPTDSHLNGTTVSVILDGLYRGEFACSAGGVIVVGTESAITAAANVLVGKKISMVIQPRVPESAGTPRSPSTLGRNKNISSVIVNLNNSRGVKVNGYEADMEFKTVSDIPIPTAVQGWFEVPVAGLYGTQPIVELSSDRPYGAEIVGVSIDMSVEG